MTKTREAALSDSRPRTVFIGVVPRSQMRTPGLWAKTYVALACKLSFDAKGALRWFSSADGWTRAEARAACERVVRQSLTGRLSLLPLQRDDQISNDPRTELQPS